MKESKLYSSQKQQNVRALLEHIHNLRQTSDCQCWTKLEKLHSTYCWSARRKWKSQLISAGIKQTWLRQNYWASELWSSSRILNNRKENDSQTRSVSDLRWVEGDNYSVESLRKCYWVIWGTQKSKVSPPLPLTWGRKQIQFPKLCVL
jgi:hypothetical protein